MVLGHYSACGEQAAECGVSNVARVYELEYRTAGGVRGGRAVNFFNLVNEGDGWKVMNIVWDNEREGVSLHDTGLS